MTYIPNENKGNFPVGILNTTTTVPSTNTQINNGNLNLDVFYTTEGQLDSSPTVSGLAYSDTRCDSSVGVSPFLSQGPTSDGGFGSDSPENLAVKPCGSSLGCGIYNSETIKLYYYNYDQDRILSDSYVCCFGEIL